MSEPMRININFHCCTNFSAGLKSSFGKPQEVRLKTAPAHLHLFLFAIKLLSDNYALKDATIYEFLLYSILYVHIEEDLDF